MTTRLTCWAAILLSVAAIAYAGWMHATLQGRVDAAVENRLRAREDALVQSLWEDMDKVYRDFGVPSPKEPKSLEELVRPLIHLGTRLIGADGSRPLPAALQRRVAAEVDRDVRIREQLAAKRLQRELDKVYADFGIKGPKDPKTIHEVIEPLLALFEKLRR